MLTRDLYAVDNLVDVDAFDELTDKTTHFISKNVSQLFNSQFQSDILKVLLQIYCRGFVIWAAL